MDSKSERSSLWRRVGAAAVVLALVAAACAAMTFAMFPYGSRTVLTWTEFREDSNIDTLCIGSSIGAQSFDPTVIDEGLSAHSFNLCTDSQKVCESYIGLKEAIEHHEVKRVFYAVDFGMFWDSYDEYPGRVFFTAKWAGDNPMNIVSDLSYALDGTKWMFNERSLNWMFPWTEERVGPSQVKKNIQMRLDGTTMAEAQAVNSKKRHYPLVDHGQGYSNYEGACDFNANYQNLYTDKKIKPVQEKNLKYLVDICNLCKENGIELITYIPPRPDFSTIDFKDHYAEFTQAIKSTVESNGGSYYDFNLAKPELLRYDENNFWDWEHLNAQGAREFSKSLVSMVQKIDSGENVDSLFMTLDEKLASIDTISLAILKDKTTDEGIELRARALTGTNVVPEYQFLVEGPDGSMQVIQDYSTESKCLYKPEEFGVHKVRLNVRPVGSNDSWQRHTQHTVTG